MALTDELNMEPELEILTLRSRHTKIFMGVIFTGMSLPGTYGLLSKSNTHTSLFDWIFCLLMSLLFLSIGIYLCLPRTVRTTFDLRSREMEHRVIFCDGLHERVRKYSFSEVEGLAVQKCIGEDVSFSAIARLKNGRSCGLSESSSSSTGAQVHFKEIIQSVSDFTGLPVLQLPTRGT
jgi:hypothetical protein